MVYYRIEVSEVLFSGNTRMKVHSSLVNAIIAMAYVSLASSLASYGETSTFVEGILSESTTWTLSASPYVITGDLTVVMGATLIIEPGVEVRFNGNFSMIINGSLYAVGTKEKGITFTSTSLTPNTGDWNTLKFAGASNESFIIESCIVAYAKNGITVQSLGKALIGNSRIMNNSVSGIHVMDESNIIIKENTIRLNTNGISSIGTVATGIKVLNNIIDSNNNGIYIYVSSTEISQIKNITILGNTFSNNENGVKFNMFPITSGKINNVTISQNTVTLNKNGIHLTIWGGFIDYATNSIYDTLITKNIVDSNEKYGIYLNCSGPWLGSIYRVSISDNKIVSNGIGMHIFANTHNPNLEFDMVISNNTISANMDKGIYVYGGVSRPVEEGIRTNLTRNSLSYNVYGVLYEGDTENIAHFNDIYYNTYGMYVSNGATANATQNYWGTPTGPNHNSLNPSGKGNSVNGDGANLIFEPFLASAVVNKRPVAVLKADKTEVTLNQIVTFNASMSNDDGRIVSYLFDFGDGTNSSWVIQQLVVHSYTSSGIYRAYLKVLDELGFKSNNTALITIKAQPSLIVAIDVDSEAVKSDENLTISIQVTDGSNPISNANVSLSSDKGGVFSHETEKTNSTGHFESIFTAPTVTEKTNTTITVKTAKSGFWNGQKDLELNVLPKGKIIGIDFFWVFAGIALIVISIFLALTLLKASKKTKRD